MGLLISNITVILLKMHADNKMTASHMSLFLLSEIYPFCFYLNSENTLKMNAWK